MNCAGWWWKSRISGKTPQTTDMEVKPWILAARPKTLPAAMAPVLVGSALACHEGWFQLLPAGICLAFALLIQVATNFANDYYDFKKGADTADRVGPTRAVASGLIQPHSMKAAAGLAFALAFVVGLGLIPFGGWWLLAVGLSSILCGYAYTTGPLPLAYVGLGDLFVMLFFGLVAVCCTFYVQAGYLTVESVLAATAIGALSTNLLVVNNLRDIETDRLANKKTLAVRWGRTFAVWEYRVFVALPFAVAVLLAYRLAHPWALLALAAAPLGLILCLRLPRAKTGAAFNPLLAGTALLLLVYSITISLGLVIG